MAGRRTNLGLLVWLAVAFATGAAAYAMGTGWNRWITIAHGVAGFGIVVLTPWKSVVVRRGLGRERAGKAASVFMGILVGVSVASGVVHAFGVRLLPLDVTAMQIHVGTALAVLPFAVWHVVARPARPRRTDVSRRAVLRAAGVTAGAGGLWLATEAAVRVLPVQGGDRRFTGSHEVGSFDPVRMPVTQWLDDEVPTIDEEAWRLVVADADGERRLAAPDVAREHRSVRATLDCTGGWFAVQDWEGVSLDRLVAPGDARSVVVTSATGYGRRFPVRDLPRLLLATTVGGRALSPGHGFPARLVAPGRRGFWWVKWVTEIRTSDRPWWLQSPFPLT
ncbi:MAG TPA: molybdopterin-dependent oxidoreductase [Acidimicrobiia bacterium]|nr:molybdopterin-dependent oxidoreductase [Acidimicrobiia bacterium]